MATIRKRKGKWEVRIRRFGNKTMFRTFIECRDAEKWAREYEAKLEKGLFEDLSHANAVTLKELLQQYCSEVSSTKLGYVEEKYKMKSRTVISLIVVIIILFLARTIYSDHTLKKIIGACILAQTQTSNLEEAKQICVDKFK